MEGRREETKIKGGRVRRGRKEERLGRTERDISYSLDTLSSSVLHLPCIVNEPIIICKTKKYIHAPRMAYQVLYSNT